MRDGCVCKIEGVVDGGRENGIQECDERVVCMYYHGWKRGTRGERNSSRRIR